MVDKEKVIIKTDEYLDATEKTEGLKNVLKSYIPTKKDIDKMREYPGKYMAFMHYFLAMDRSDVSFTEEKQELLKEAEVEINDIIQKNLTLV